MNCLQYSIWGEKLVKAVKDNNVPDGAKLIQKGLLHGLTYRMIWFRVLEEKDISRYQWIEFLMKCTNKLALIPTRPKIII